ncbi:MAG: terpene synthase family protein [Gammaproteobacteria bacterium]
MVLKNLTFPRLTCPFPESISPFAYEIQEHTVQWASQHQLVNGSQAVERLRRSKFGRLIARTYPNAPQHPLEIVADWNTWLFIFDDQCDECGLGRNPNQLSGVHDRCLEILCGIDPTPADLPLVHALHDIYTRLKPLGSRTWLTRFAKNVSEYFEGTLWEARNRYHKRWPNTAAYVRMRPFTGGLYTDIDLIEITEEINLSCVVRSHPHLNKLVGLTNNVVCWSNDVISLQKENEHGDMHNLVLILHHESNFSLQQSLDYVKCLIDNQIQRFLRIEKQLPSFGEEIDRDIARFVAVLRSWMRGNLDWAYESGRYEELIEKKAISRINGYENGGKKAWLVGRKAVCDLSAEADLCVK